MRFDYFVRGTPCTCLRRLWRNESGRIEAMRPGHAYFVVLLVGYGVGLALAFLFNMLGITINASRASQPALPRAMHARAPSGDVVVPGRISRAMGRAELFR